jgi:hypothetical protein
MLSKHLMVSFLTRDVATAGRFLLVLASLAGCGQEQPSARSDAGAPSSRCVAPAGTTASPQSIADVVTLLNALPKPVTLPCFVETLARPLAIHATQSAISAQPSVGARSPRIFLLFETLRMSIVPAGMGSRLLEFGEIRPEAHSVKAEIEFPVEATLAPEVPFERVMFSDIATGCSFCHADEQPAADFTFTKAFTSASLRPADSKSVSIPFLSNEADTCDPTAEPDRCALLKSLVDQGELVEQAFPTDLATLF